LEAPMSLHVIRRVLTIELCAIPRPSEPCAAHGDRQVVVTAAKISHLPEAVLYVLVRVREFGGVCGNLLRRISARYTSD
jgi:hypothetical protein